MHSRPRAGRQLLQPLAPRRASPRRRRRRACRHTSRQSARQFERAPVRRRCGYDRRRQAARRRRRWQRWQRGVAPAFRRGGRGGAEAGVDHWRGRERSLPCATSEGTTRRATAQLPSRGDVPLVARPAPWANGGGGLGARAWINIFSGTTLSLTMRRTSRYTPSGLDQHVLLGPRLPSDGTRTPRPFRAQVTHTLLNRTSPPPCYSPQARPAHLPAANRTAPYRPLTPL